MEAVVARISPLVEELAAFCAGHELGDGGVAASRMLSHVRELWPEAPAEEIGGDPEGEVDPEIIALRIVRDVGETAGRLIDPGREDALGWARANLVIELERYLAVVGGR